MRNVACIGLLLVASALVVTAAPVSAHTLTRGDAEYDAYSKVSSLNDTFNIDVTRCWRRNRHMVICGVDYDHYTDDAFSDFCLDNPSSCEESCHATVRVRYRYPTSYITS